jgi:hypothetical protein
MIVKQKATPLGGLLWGGYILVFRYFFEYFDVLIPQIFALEV